MYDGMFKFVHNRKNSPSLKYLDNVHEKLYERKIIEKNIEN
jgi:hypothetical protein